MSELEPLVPATTTSLANEARYIASSSLPLVVSFFLQYVLSVISIYACGRLGPTELAAASLAVCTFNITALAFYQGLATALDSFCSQAYGSGKPHNVGYYAQRGVLMMAAITVFPLGPILYFSGPILSRLVPDTDLALMAQTFLRITLVGAPPLFAFEAGKRFLQAQNLFNAGTQILLVATPISIVLNWLLVWHPVYGLGYVGAPIAMVIVYWIMFILLVVYVRFVDGLECWGGFSWSHACKNWGAMIKLALPGVVMMETEYLAFEVLTILAASFGTISLATQSIASNVSSLVFQCPFAISVALTTRVGHYVGAKSTHGARTVLQVFVFACFLTALFNFLVVFFGRSFWAHLFTNDPDVIDLTKLILTFSAFMQLMDMFNVLSAGILRGQGRQRIGLVLNVLAYYFVSLPLGYYLAFHHHKGLVGLWTGLLCGVFVLASTELYYVWITDWELVFEESSERHD